MVQGKWMRRAAWTAGGLASLWVVTWLAVPPLVRWLAPARLSAVLGRDVTIGAVDFHPWALEIVRLTDVTQAAHAIRSMQVRGAPLIGAAAASAGLVLGTALKMVRNIRPTALALGIGAAGFAAIGLLRWPLVPVVVVLVPLAIVAAWLGRRK